MQMAMETSLMQGLMSVVIGERQKSCEKLVQILGNGETVSDEIVKKIIFMIADSNVLIAAKAMDCIEASTFNNSFQSLPQNIRNNAFDSLINRLADGKTQMRSKAKDVLSSMATKIDVIPLLQKFTSLISSRNVYLKRNMVQITMEIVENTIIEEHDTNLRRLICLVGLTSMNDADGGIKEAGLMLLRTAMLQLGDGFQTALREAGAKAEVFIKLNTNTSSLSRSNSRPNITTRITNNSASLVLPVEEEPIMISSVLPSISGNNDDEIPASYDPQTWLSFAMENATPMELKTETETQRFINGIEQDLRGQDDWQKRMEALISLRGLALGSLRESNQVGTYLRRLQDLLDIQLADPRSTITKECCRALTALSLRLKGVCLPTIELCWPKMVKLLVSKTQLTAQAADIFVRVLIFSCEDSKVLSWFADLVRSKNAVHRRLGLEYLLLATARWPADLIDRFFPYLQSSLRSGLTDADSEARKVARLLFRSLQCSKLTSPRMKRMESELDPTATKYLHSEEQPVVDLDYLNRLRVTPMEVDNKLTKDDRMIPPPNAALMAPLPPATLELIDDGMDWLDNALLDDDNQDLNKSSNNIRRSTFATPAVGGRGKTTAGGINKRMSLAGPARLLSQPAQSLTQGDAVSVSESDSVSGSVGLSRPRRMSLAASAPAPMVMPVVNNDPASQQTHHSIMMTVEKENRRGSLMPGTVMMPMTNNRRESIGALNNGPRRILQPVIQPLTTNNLPISETDSASLDKSVVIRPSAVTAVVKDTNKVIVPQLNLEIFRSYLSTKSGLLKALEMYHKHLQLDSGTLVDMKFLSDTFGSVLDGLVDSNTKVATVAVDILDLLLPAAQNKYAWIASSQQCASMIKYFFCGLVDSKPIIRDHIQRLLTTLRTHFSHAILFAATMTSLKDVPERVMAAAFQFAGAILPTSHEYFQQSSQVNDFLAKMLFCLVDIKATPVAQLAGKRLIIKAIESHGAIFVKVIAGMALAQQTAIKSLLNSKLVVDLEQKLLQQAKKDKIASSQQLQQHQQQQAPLSEQRSALATQLLKKVEEVTIRLSPAAKCEEPAKKQPLDEKTLEQVVLQTCRSPSAISPGFVKANCSPPQIPFQAWSEPVFAAPIPSPQPVKTIEWIIDGLQQSCLSSQHQSAMEALVARIKISDSSFFQDHTATIVLAVLEALQQSHHEESKQDTSEFKKSVHETLLKKYRLLLKILRSSSSQSTEDHRPIVDEEGAGLIIAAMFGVIRPVYPADIFHAQLMDFFAALLISLLRPYSATSMVSALKEGIYAAVNADRDNFLAVLTAIRGFSLITSLMVEGYNKDGEDRAFVLDVCKEVTAFLLSSCLGHELAEIRQQSTLLLADMYRALGEEMLPWIESMTAMQRKVLMVYVHKTMVTTAAN